MNIDKLKKYILELEIYVEDIINQSENFDISDDDIYKKFEFFKELLIKESPINLQNQIKRLKLYETIELGDGIFEETTYHQIFGSGMQDLLKLYKEKEFEITYSDNKEDLYKKKLLDAKNKNIDFFEDLAKMVVGDNEAFPYRSSTYITRFFSSVGMPQYTHDGSTRRLWVADILRSLSLDELYIIIKCLFRLKDFRVNKKDITLAKKELEKLIEESIEEDEFIDLSDVFNLNINTELLYTEEIETEDETLNSKIKTAKEFYIKGEFQHAVEDIWDVFERVKSLYHANKSTSSDIIAKALSDEITSFNNKDINEKEFVFFSELFNLAKLGNNYQIRHFEAGKQEILNKETQKYLYFRMLSLVTLILNRMEK